MQADVLQKFGMYLDCKGFVMVRRFGFQHASSHCIAQLMPTTYASGLGLQPAECATHYAFLRDVVKSHSLSKLCCSKFPACVKHVSSILL